MSRKSLSKIGTILRWGVAVVGIYWVLSQITWHSQVFAILPGSNVPQRVNLASPNAQEGDLEYEVVSPSGKIITLSRDKVVNEPDKSKMQVNVIGQSKPQYLIAVDLSADHQPRRLLVAPTLADRNPIWITPRQAPEYQVTIPHPRVQQGVIRMVSQANLYFLLGAILVIPFTILITSYRWHELLRALDVRITLSRAFVLNMVGLFYNTFMLGSTGGDVAKAYYVAKQTHHRTRAVMGVVVDRVIGLMALIILGGVMATLQWRLPMCRRVAIGAAIILFCTAAGLILFYSAQLRRISGLDFIISKLPMQAQVQKAIDTMHILHRRPLLVGGALLISFPVHMFVVVSAMLAGKAFGLPISPLYYWMAVPVIVLASAIPISPQGAGVMEYFAFVLLGPQGVTVAQTVALTVSIRLVQILWNLTGSFFVLRGGFHIPSQTEQHQVEDEDEDKDEPTQPAGQTMSV